MGTFGGGSALCNIRKTTKADRKCSVGQPGAHVWSSIFWSFGVPPQSGQRNTENDDIVNPRFFSPSLSFVSHIRLTTIVSRLHLLNTARLICAVSGNTTGYALTDLFSYRMLRTVSPRQRPPRGGIYRTKRAKILPVQ
jgi:hypothetical protein